MAKKAVIYSALVLALVIALQGCYTMIKHPRVDYVDHANEYYTKNCFSCHEDLGEYPYGSNYAAYPGYWQSYHNWGEYYRYPWWWESYWWDIRIEDNENAYDYYPPGGVNRRRGLLPGDAWQYILSPNEITNQTPPAGGGDDGGTATGTDDGDDSKPKEPNKEPDQKDPPKKPERRRLPQ